MNREKTHRKIARACRRLMIDVRGATAIEYGLIVALVVLVMLAALAEVGHVTSGMWDNISTKVTNAH